MVAYNQPIAASFPSGPKIVVSDNEIGFKIPDQNIIAIGGDDLLFHISNVDVILYITSPPGGVRSAYFSFSLNLTCDGWQTWTAVSHAETPGGMYFGVEFLDALGGGLNLWNTDRFNIACTDSGIPKVWQENLDPNLFPLVSGAKVQVFSDVNFTGCHG